MGLVVVHFFAVPVAGLAVRQLHSVALAASHHVSAVAAARDHSRGECDGGRHRTLADQSRRRGVAGIPARAVRVDVGAYRLGPAGAPGAAARAVAA